MGEGEGAMGSSTEPAELAEALLSQLQEPTHAMLIFIDEASDVPDEVWTSSFQPLPMKTSR